MSRCYIVIIVRLRKTKLKMINVKMEASTLMPLHMSIYIIISMSNIINIKGGE